MKNNKQLRRLLLSLIGGLFITAMSFGQNLKVATAANLQSVIGVLQKDFKQKTGIEIEPDCRLIR